MADRRDVYLIDGQTTEPIRVPAVLLREMDPRRLVKVEELWNPARDVVRDAMELSGGHMEHAHWDWKNKIDRIYHGELLLTALECDGEIQGLIAVASSPRYSVIRYGEQALYVDYIETAPWNLRTITEPPRFRGVGSLLLADVVHRSQEMGFAGRVSLHSIPSAEGFYRDQCRMTEVGTDPAYNYLQHFEYNEKEAAGWLLRCEGLS